MPGLGLAFGAFDRHPRGIQTIAQGAHHTLFFGGLQDAVIFVIRADRRQIAVACFAQLFKALFKQEKFQFGGANCVKTHVRQTCDLFFQHRTRRMGNLGMSVMIHHVTNDQSRAFQPRRAAQCGEVRLHQIVAISGGPAGGGIAFHRVHFQIGGQQIVATMGFFPRAVDEMLRHKTLAHQPALHIHDACQNGIDFAARTQCAKLF